LIIQNIIEAEKQIAFFRSFLILVILIHTFFVAYANNRVSVSDVANFYCLGVALEFGIGINSGDAVKVYAAKV